MESDLLHEMTPDLSMDFTGKRVFVVEDNALNMEIACMLLDTFGIEVKEVYNLIFDSWLVNKVPQSL